MKKTESAQLRATLQFFSYQPDIISWRLNVGAVKIDERFIRFGVAGMSDVVSIMRVGGIGVFLAVEQKKTGTKQTKKQREFQLLVESVGGVYILTRDIADLASQLNEARGIIRQKITREK